MKKSTLAPRNGHVAAMKLRSSGAHGKTKKAIRKAEKQALRKQVTEHHDGCHSLTSFLVLLFKSAAAGGSMAILMACSDDFDKTPDRQMTTEGVTIISAYHEMNNRPKIQAALSSGHAKNGTAMSVGITISPTSEN